MQLSYAVSNYLMINSQFIFELSPLLYKITAYAIYISDIINVITWRHGYLILPATLLSLQKMVCADSTVYIKAMHYWLLMQRKLRFPVVYPRKWSIMPKVFPYHDVAMILIRIYIPSPNGLGIRLPVSHALLCIVTTNHEATPEPVFIP